MPRKKSGGGDEAAKERLAKIESIVAESGRMFGAGSVGTLRGEYALGDQVRTIVKSGSLGLDEALGVGGYPKGRVIEIYGAESSGKTTLALHAVAEAQKMGDLAGFVDAEHALDPAYAEALGVDIEALLISQPDYGEQALEIADTLISGGCGIVVIDSVAALVPKSELDGDMGDHHPGAQARLMSQALRKLTAKVNKSECLVIFINQTRFKIGVQWGSPKTTSGGQALKFYSSIRLDVARIGSFKKGDEALGNKTRVKVVKNKVAPPFKQTEFEIVFGQGISQGAEVLDRAVEAKIVTKSGAWYSYGEARLGHGKQNAVDFLRENADVREEIIGKLP